jgi:ankyrin repeat protein
MTPLFYACKYGRDQVATALLRGGANIDFASPPRHAEHPGFTPLIFAAVNNHTGVVKLLLKRGADGTKMRRCIMNRSHPC